MFTAFVLCFVSVLCGERVNQMSRTYSDEEAMLSLIKEKESDLELAARIGQQLLARNKVGSLTDLSSCQLFFAFFFGIFGIFLAFFGSRLCSCKLI